MRGARRGSFQPSGLHPMVPIATASIWEPPPAGDVLRWPLPHQVGVNRLLVRGLALLARQKVVSLAGVEHLLSDRDPFILAINHSTRTEALLVPALLTLRRGGKLIHFLADWNYRLIPGIGLLYRRGETVTVMRKSARPPLLNVLRPFYRHPLSALERARLLVLQGRSVGFFPEGTVNRDPLRLLPGRRGAARLSLETGASVIPVGIRFPDVPPGRPITDGASMQIHVGAPLAPRRCFAGQAPLAEVRAWHAAVMEAIGRLSGKSWQAPTWEIGNARH
jgi:1-acyl-sn-glycerol-3-phosphate acyltransferase